jgi:hypothetical protein
MQKVSFRNNRNMVTRKRELAIRIDQRDDWHSSTLFSLPGRHHEFSNSAVQEQDVKRCANLECWKVVEEKTGIMVQGLRGQRQKYRLTH